MQLLDHQQIQQKIRRLAYQIWEQNFEESELILAGINERGMALAQLLMQELLALTDFSITMTRIVVDFDRKEQDFVHHEIPSHFIQDKVIIIIDDVANTGKTIFYALRPLMYIFPKKVEIAVLVDRKHKGFPIRADYIGLSLSTTLNENIRVSFEEEGAYLATLEE